MSDGTISCDVPGRPGWRCTREAGHQSPGTVREIVGTVVDAEAVAARVTDAMFDALSQTYVLPEAQLKELVATGKIMTITTFEDHMRPDVHWISPAEYGMAFDEIIGETTMPDDRNFQAAHTDADGPLPSYINVRKGMLDGTVIVTVRSAKDDKEGSALDGATAHHIMDLQDFDQWIADAQRLRQALG